MTVNLDVIVMQHTVQQISESDLALGVIASIICCIIVIVLLVKVFYINEDKV